MPKNVTTQLQKQLTSQVAHSSCNPSQGSKAPEMVFPGMGAPKGPSLWAPPKLYLGNYLGNSFSQVVTGRWISMYSLKNPTNHVTF